MSEPLVFRYTAVDISGRRVKDVLRADDARTATRLLNAEGLTPLTLNIEKPAAVKGSNRALKFTDRLAVLVQLALMADAGVGLLEAVQTVSQGIASDAGRAEFEAINTALKRGEPFASAFEAHSKGYPFYVHAMSRVGEATGRLGEVLRDAADQMAYEDRLRRDFVNAMTYPGFLAGAGFLAVFFIFTQVVPRFSAMIGDKHDKLPLVSKIVLDVGEAANKNVILILIAMGGVVFGVVAALSNGRVREAIYQFGHTVPVVGQLLKAREISAWARLTSFALANGVQLLEAATLARLATPNGAFQRGLEQFEQDLKAGVAIEVSLARNSELTPMDLSLLRAGQKSGTLPRMMKFVADSYDSKLRDLLKRVTALIEPISIGFISILVGVVALSLVLALSSVYDSVF